jgi:hypothetical protein
VTEDFRDSWAKWSDKALVESFLRRVKRLTGPEIRSKCPGITEHDVSRWRRGQYSRLSPSKRSAIIEAMHQDASAHLEDSERFNRRLGARIRHAREAAGIELRELPELVPDAFVDYAEVERGGGWGEESLDLKAFVEMARIFGLTPNDLLLDSREAGSHDGKSEEPVVLLGATEVSDWGVLGEVGRMVEAWSEQGWTNRAIKRAHEEVMARFRGAADLFEKLNGTRQLPVELQQHLLSEARRWAEGAIGPSYRPLRLATGGFETVAKATITREGVVHHVVYRRTLNGKAYAFCDCRHYHDNGDCAGILAYLEGPNVTGYTTNDE